MLVRLLEISEQLGVDDLRRNNLDFPFAKAVEELGEISVELNIVKGLLPPEKGGNEGLVSECMDLANCCFDLAYIYLKRQYPMMTPQQAADIFGTTLLAKRQRWVEKVTAQPIGELEPGANAGC